MSNTAENYRELIGEHWFENGYLDKKSLILTARMRRKMSLSTIRDYITTLISTSKRYVT